MKDFLEEFGYMCSSANTSSRGFYIGLAIGLVLLLLGIIASAGMIVYSLIKRIPVSPMNYGLLVGCTIVFVGFIVWLKRG